MPSAGPWRLSARKLASPPAVDISGDGVSVPVALTVATHNERSAGDWDLIAAAIARSQQKPKKTPAFDQTLAATVVWRIL